MTSTSRSLKSSDWLAGWTRVNASHSGMRREAACGEGIAIVDSATATASALAELLSVNGLEAPDQAVAPAGRVGPSHIQLTTGDVAQFRLLASRLFDQAFGEVSRIDLQEAVS